MTAEIDRTRGMCQRTGFSSTRVLSYAMVMIGRSSSSARAMIITVVNGRNSKTIVDRTTTNMMSMVIAMR